MDRRQILTIIRAASVVVVMAAIVAQAETPIDNRRLPGLMAVGWLKSSRGE